MRVAHRAPRMDWRGRGSGRRRWFPRACRTSCRCLSSPSRRRRAARFRSDIRKAVNRLDDLPRPPVPPVADAEPLRGYVERRANRASVSGFMPVRWSSPPTMRYPSVPISSACSDRGRGVPEQPARRRHRPRQWRKSDRRRSWCAEGPGCLPGRSPPRRHAAADLAMLGFDPAGSPSGTPRRGCARRSHAMRDRLVEHLRGTPSRAPAPVDPTGCLRRSGTATAPIRPLHVTPARRRHRARRQAPRRPQHAPCRGSRAPARSRADADRPGTTRSARSRRGWSERPAARRLRRRPG